jgi:hypothetical protein
MALYSTWDWNRNAYRVYQTPTPVSVGDDPVSPKPSITSALGADPDTQVNVLPSGAKFMGYSHMARGEIRRASNGLGDSTAPEQTPLWKQPLVMFAAGVAATWVFFKVRG